MQVMAAVQVSAPLVPTTSMPGPEEPELQSECGTGSPLQPVA